MPGSWYLYAGLATEYLILNSKAGGREVIWICIFLLAADKGDLNQKIGSLQNIYGLIALVVKMVHLNVFWQCILFLPGVNGQSTLQPETRIKTSLQNLSFYIFCGIYFLILCGVHFKLFFILFQVNMTVKLNALFGGLLFLIQDCMIPINVIGKQA